MIWNYWGGESLRQKKMSTWNHISYMLIANSIISCCIVNTSSHPEISNVSHICHIMNIQSLHHAATSVYVDGFSFMNLNACQWPAMKEKINE